MELTYVVPAFLDKEGNYFEGDRLKNCDLAEYAEDVDADISSWLHQR
jgi:hypothetical protein